MMIADESETPIIVLSTNDDCNTTILSSNNIHDYNDIGVFKKPQLVAKKKPLSASIINTSTTNSSSSSRSQGRWSRSEPNLFSNDFSIQNSGLGINDLDENKENMGNNNSISNNNAMIVLKTRQLSPSSTPTKFLEFPSPASPELSPTNLNQMMGNMVIYTASSPTKLGAPSQIATTRLISERLEATRNMHRIESEQFVRKLKGLIKEEAVEEALTHIRATMSPRQKTILPILMNTSQPELNCLSSQTVADLVDGKFRNIYTKIIILDCRFEYEYGGGHIKGAMNFPTEDCLDSLFIKCDQYQTYGENLCLVFHCEFSSHRAPKAYKHLRSWDRKKNENSYPQLFFPEMYLLDGGYKKFFEECPNWCEPRGYIEMKDSSHINECRLAMINRGRSKSCRKYLSRSCTNIMEEFSGTPTSSITTSLTPFSKRSSPFSGFRESPNDDNLIYNNKDNEDDN